MIRIPSHIRYPAMIFGLLGMTLVVNIILVTATRSDGGAQVVDDYYEQSIHWDEQAAIRRESNAHRWSLSFEMERDQPGRLEVVGPDKSPVEGLAGKVRLRRPQLADDVAVAELRPVAGKPGTYQFEHPATRAGLWDFIIEAQYRGKPILLQERQRIR